MKIETPPKKEKEHSHGFPFERHAPGGKPVQLPKEIFDSEKLKNDELAWDPLVEGGKEKRGN